MKRFVLSLSSFFSSRQHKADRRLDMGKRHYSITFFFSFLLGGGGGGGLGGWVATKTSNPTSFLDLKKQLQTKLNKSMPLYFKTNIEFHTNQ